MGRAGASEVGIWLAAAAVAQSAGDPEAEMADLLGRARQAMKQGNYEVAESLIDRAASLGVKPKPFSLKDTPDKARRDLEKLKSGNKGLSGLVPDILKGKDQPPQKDPFEAASRGPQNNPPLPMNFDGMAGPVNPYAAPNDASAPSLARMPQPQNSAAVAAREQSNQLLITARKALAVGDVRRAKELAAQARSLGITYDEREDMPAKVEALIAKHESLQQMRAQLGDSESYWHAYGQLLLEQADAMLRWRQYDEAENLANTAASLPIQYLPFEANPKDVLARVAAERQGGVRFGPVLGSPQDAKRQAQDLVQRSQAAMAAGDLNSAEWFLQQAEALGVPDSAFGPGELSPGILAYEIRRARAGQGSTVQIGGAPPANNQVGFYQVPGPPGGVRTVQGVENGPGFAGPAPQPAASLQGDGRGVSLLREAEQALQAGNSTKARELYLQAEQFQGELDPNARDLLRNRLIYLGRTPQGGALDAAAQQQAVIRKQLSATLANAQRQARNLQQADPERALIVLEQARGEVERSTLDQASKEQLLRRVDGDIAALRQYITDNRPRIELEKRNQAVRDSIERERVHRVEVQERLAVLVNDINQLMEEQRFAEAEVKIKQAMEIAPNDPVVRQLRIFSNFVRRNWESTAIAAAKEQGFFDQLASVDQASTGFDDRVPIVFPDVHDWKQMTERRKGLLVEKRRTEKEIDILQKLRTPVSLRFQQTPLHEVMDYLARLSQVNIHLDPQGLSDMGVDPNTPVTIELNTDISLKSALNLILEPLGLSYVVKDEVLKITSEQLRDGEVITITYNVADLVIPIPNFVPSVNMGMTGALNEAYRQAGFLGGGAHAPIFLAASQNGGTTNAAVDPAVLANVSGSSTSPGYAIPQRPMGSGPGGAGGGVEPDFDSLIELITTTIAPTTWDEVGGPGSIAPFETNLSLVISQTQEVHEKIADLLEQLRRLQDLQVTIEVRFITLNDNFFERIGIDFDFDIDDDIDRPQQTFGRFNPSTTTAFADPTAFNVNTGVPNRDVQDRDHGQDVTVGLAAPGLFSADLDIPFNAGSFPLATPQFGGFQPGSGAQLGFAILSDLEAFFFIEASQGDRRSNVLQAPKVTLFNGQSATVADQSQTPFVISVIPVVGDFAAAQQPVIVILNEGTFLNVQAVVSQDRRFVRLTVVPFFSTIGDVSTFTFQGDETTIVDSLVDVDPDAEDPEPVRTRTTRSGTTVQLPTFSFFTVATTVSVPDGGTVLLGGIKRLSEGRNEFGVPILNKVPYVSRLFRNVGIGRETQSLMMMVTPRIIIQEEEEELLGFQTSP
jgi:general secretion pathway protein D